MSQEWPVSAFMGGTDSCACRGAHTAAEAPVTLHTAGNLSVDPRQVHCLQSLWATGEPLQQKKPRSNRNVWSIHSANKNEEGNLGLGAFWVTDDKIFLSQIRMYICKEINNRQNGMALDLTVCLSLFCTAVNRILGSAASLGSQF